MLGSLNPKWVRSGLILLAVGSVAAAAAPVVWHANGFDRVIPPVAKLRGAPADQAPQTDLTSTLALAPFGTPVTASVTPDAPSAAFDLTLLGVIVRDDPARSLALISSADSEGNFRVGQEPTPGTKITGIFQDRVAIRVNGIDRILIFAGAEDRPEEVAVPTGSARLQTLLNSGQGTSISDQVDAAQRAEPVTTQDYINMWRDRINANPSEVLDTIGLVPTENGYIIADKHDVGVNRAGLKAGDLVTSVNGKAVGNVGNDRALYDVIAESGLARIEVERDGRTIVMSFPLQ
jgi:general secretion pathway protein C